MKFPVIAASFNCTSAFSARTILGSHSGLTSKPYVMAMILPARVLLSPSAKIKVVPMKLTIRYDGETASGRATVAEEDRGSAKAVWVDD